MYTAVDHAMMGRAIALARHGLWTTTPNPRVGCVLARDDSVVGEGWHQLAGQAHAEVNALAAAGERARGATAYITLEPCSHHGRTPPCVGALLQAGVTRVVAAMSDPNPRVAGAGLAHLRAAGVVVRCGLLEVEARELNPGFISRMTRGLPWVRLKAAASLDGFTALTDGRSQWITGPQARADGHAWRARACAILTGIGTVREDDPQLTVRDVDGHPDGPPADWAGPARQPLRVVVDSRLEIDPGAKLVRGGELLLVHAVDPQWLRVGPLAEKAQRLRDHGVELLALPASNPVGKVDLRALLDHLAQLEINELHVEAGARLNASFLREGCIDEMLIYLAPMLLGVGRGLFDLAAPTTLEGAPRMRLHALDRIGDDVRILARVEPS
jgi:diaminohydroxyphosphoribosylaminopyrimidine deaminase/5-amino-6-(5-phosphoribosylamino)uracil reductase